MTGFRPSRTVAAIAAFASLAACAPVSVSAPAVIAPAVQFAQVVPKEIHWFRNSAEMRGIYLEIYHLAADRLDVLAAENAPQTWAVIMDADETVLDNSAFEKELGRAPYTEKAWSAWVERKASGALPGAVEFTRTVHRLGGRVIIVTNRDSAQCGATRENLKADSIDADLVLCRTTTGDKNPRFEAVVAGTASPSLRALKVLMYFGDNIQDFPKLSQALRDGADAGYANFGKSWFLLPNPMYGSWEKVTYR